MGGQKGTQRHAMCCGKESGQRPEQVIIEKEKWENDIPVGIIRAKESRQMEVAWDVTEQNIQSTPGQIPLAQIVSQRNLFMTKKARSVNTGEEVAARSQEDWS